MSKKKNKTSAFKEFVKKTKKSINEVRKKCKRNKLSLLLDMFWSYIIYGASQEDYITFYFYELRIYKDTYLTMLRNNRLNKKFNDVLFNKYFEDRKLFNEKFDDFLGRKTYDINELTYKEFEELSKEKKILICKSYKTNSKNKVEKVDTSKFRGPGFAIEYIRKQKIEILEEEIPQHKIMSKVNPSSLNTITFVSVLNGNKTDILYSTVCFGVEGENADNYENSLFGKVDVKTGEIRGNLSDINGKVYECHPNSNIKFDGFKIPLFDECIDMINELSKVIKEVRRVEWKLCITPRKVILVSADSYIDYNISQLSEYVSTKKGLMKYYLKYLK